MSRLSHAKWLDRLFLTLGVAVLTTLVVRLDAREVGARILQGGWMLIPSFALYVGSLVCSTLAWRAIIDRTQSRARFAHLLAVFWAGHAVNKAAAGGMGEAFKASLLRGRVKAEERVASLVSYNFLTTAVTVGFTALGPLLCLVLLDLPTRVVGALFGVTLVAAVVLAGVWGLLRWGVAGPVVRLVSKLPFVNFHDLDKVVGQARSVDERIRSLRQRQRGGFWQALGWITLVRVLLAAELWLLLVALMPERPLGWTVLVALLTQSTTRLFTWAGGWIPGRIGATEGGAALLFELVGLSPVTGVALVLLRRVRQLVGVAFGLLLGARVHRAAAGSSRPARDAPREVASSSAGQASVASRESSSGEAPVSSGGSSSSEVEPDIPD